MLGRVQAMKQDGFRMDYLFGYRFVELDDRLTIGSSTQWSVDDGYIPAGTTMQITDVFDTKNQFNGGTFGLAAEFRQPRWSLEFLGKLSMGNSHSRVSIDGSTTTNEPGLGSATTPGGLLAQPTNMGQYTANHFAVIPEIGVNLGYYVTPRLHATLGYSFIYWSCVARPGDQIDLNVNPTQFSGGTPVGTAAPVFAMKTTGFWAQGVNLGFEYRY